MMARRCPHRAPAPQPDGLPVPRRYWAIAAIILAITMSVLDSTIVNVALPSLARDFHTQRCGLDLGHQCLPDRDPHGTTAARLARRDRGLSAGVARAWHLYWRRSAARSLPPCTLSIARVVQGLGAAGIMSVNSRAGAFHLPAPDARARDRYQRLRVARAAAIGPTIASAILASLTGVGCLRSTCRSASPSSSLCTRCPTPSVSRAAELRRRGPSGRDLRAAHWRAAIAGRDAMTPIALAEIAGGCCPRCTPGAA